MFVSDDSSKGGRKYSKLPIQVYDRKKVRNVKCDRGRVWAKTISFSVEEVGNVKWERILEYSADFIANQLGSDVVMCYNVL